MTRKLIRSLGKPDWRMPLAIAASCFLTAIVVHKASAITTPSELRPVVAGVEHRMLGTVLESTETGPTAAATDGNGEEVCSMTEARDPVPGG
jgi:hypothetical protein